MNSRLPSRLARPAISPCHPPRPVSVWRLTGWAMLMWGVSVGGAQAVVVPNLNPASGSSGSLESDGKSPSAPQAVPDELAGALRLVEEGKIDEARTRVEGFIKDNPTSAPAHEFLGILLVLQDRVDDGLAEFEKAVAIDPAQATAITKIGDIYLARGAVEKAKAQFQQAVAANPAERHAHQRLGLMFEEEEDYAQAIIHFEKGLAGTPPEYVGIKVNLGRLYNRSRQYDRTIKLLSAVVPGDTANVPALMALGTAFLGNHNTAAALRYFERAKAVSEKGDDVRVALGIAYREAGDLEKSQAELSEALTLTPASRPARYHLAETLVALKRLPEAMELYRGVAEDKDPAVRVGITNRMAEVHAQNNQPDEALALYQSLRKSGEASVRTYEGLITLLQLKDQLPEAEQALREAEGKFPASSHIRYRLGLHFALQREYDKAVKELNMARAMAPADPRIQKALSLAKLRIGDLAGAIADAEQLVKTVPDSLDDQFYLATLQEQQGAAAKAEETYRRILKTNPKHAAALNNLAHLRLKANDATGALDFASQAAAVAPDTPAVLDTYGWMLHGQGKSAEARPLLERAVEKGGRPAHLYHLAEVCHALKADDKALEFLNRALADDAEFAEKDAARKLAETLKTAAPK